eukprot:6186462-Pleurochrysis_carterae.AAC.1
MVHTSDSHQRLPMEQVESGAHCLLTSPSLSLYTATIALATPFTPTHAMKSRLAVLNHTSSVLNHMSSVLNHMSSVLDHMSSALNHTSSVLNHMSSVLNYMSSVLNYMSSALNHIVLFPYKQSASNTRRASSSIWIESAGPM